MVREGLQRLDGVESVGERASHKTQTCEIRTQGGRLLQHDVLLQHILNLRVGARLRGMEATVDGWLEKQGENLVLRVSGTNEVLRLAPLVHVVQWDFQKKCPQPPTPEETYAYQNLVAESKSRSHRILVTGPVVKSTDSPYPLLEVRRFDLNP
jgi:hypothetical protein